MGVEDVHGGGWGGFDGGVNSGAEGANSAKVVYSLWFLWIKGELRILLSVGDFDYFLFRSSPAPSLSYPTNQPPPSEPTVYNPN